MMQTTQQATVMRPSGQTITNRILSATAMLPGFGA